MAQRLGTQAQLGLHEGKIALTIHDTEGTTTMLLLPFPVAKNLGLQLTRLVAEIECIAQTAVNHQAGHMPQDGLGIQEEAQIALSPPDLD